MVPSVIRKSTPSFCGISSPLTCHISATIGPKPGLSQLCFRRTSSSRRQASAAISQTSFLPVKTKFCNHNRARYCVRCKPIETFESQDQAQLLVDDVLERIKDSDSGSALSKEEQSEINDRLDELETFSDKKPLDDERIYGSYNVTYVSAGKSEKSNPAGGRFRGKLGKSLFRTTVLEQNVYEPDVILNKVGFRLFGVIPGEVTLKGTIEPDPADQRATVRAKFGSPKIKLGFVTLSFGPKSSVVLTTTYLDDRVRLGKGSRGSYFVFTRFSPTESSVDEPPGSPPWKAVVALSAVFGLAWGACTKLAIPPVWAVAAIFCVTLALALVLRNGGIVNEENRLSPASGGD